MAATDSFSLEDFFDNAPCGFHSLDREGVFLAVNDTELAWFEYQREELVGRRKFRDLLTPESQQVFAENFPVFQARGWVRDLEFEVVARSGRRLTVLLSATAILDAEHRHVASRSTLIDITGRKSAEMERDRFFALSLDLLCVSNADGYFKRLNPSFTKTLGWDQQELLTRPFLDFVHPDDRDATLREVERQMVAGETVLRFENRYRHKDGSWRWLSWTSVPQPGGFMYGSARDVTELRNAEEALRRSEQKLAVTLDSIGDGVLATDTGGRITRMNPVAERLVGWTQAEARGRPVADVFRIINEATREPAAIPVDEVLASGAVHGLANHTALIARDGRETAIADSAAPIRDADGEVAGVVLVFRDVSAEREAAIRTAALMKDLSDMRAALDEHAIVTITDPRGHITTVNDKFCAAFGYTRAELLGQNHRIVNSGHHPKEFFRRLWQTVTHGQVWKGEIRNRAKGGEIGWFDTTIVPFLKPDGTPIQFVSIQTDITERKQAEDDVRQFNTELEALVESRTADVRRALAALEEQRTQLLAQEDALRASEAKFRALFERTADALLLLDPDSGTFIDCNQAALDMLGLPEKEGLLAMHPAQLSPPYQPDGRASGEKAGDVIAIAVREGSHRFEWVHCSPFRAGFPVEVLLTPIDMGDRRVIVTTWRDITHRQRAEAELRREKAFSDAVIESVSGLFYVLDQEGRFLRWNQALQDLVGVSSEQMAVAHAESFVHEDDRELTAAKIAEALTDGHAEAELRVLGRDGIRHALLTARRMTLDGATYVAGAGVDITDRKAIEAALVEHDRFAHASLDALGAQVAILDRDGVVLAANHAWKAFAQGNQAAPDQVGEGANYLDVCDRAAGAMAAEGPAMATGIRAVIRGDLGTFLAEYPCHSPSERRWFLCRVTRFPGDGPVRVAVAHENITEIKQSQFVREQALMTLDATEDAVFIFDPETLRFTYVNQGAVRQLGHSREELLTLTPLDLRPGLDQADFRALLEPMLLGEAHTRQITTKYRHRDGHEVPVEINLQCIRLPDGGAPRFIAVVRDVTERQRAQDAILALNADLERRIAERTEQLEAARQAADSANRAKSAFLANMSHEIRTPLNAIAGMVELLEHATNRTERARMLRVTQESAKALAGIIDDVLDLSKIEAGVFDVHLEPMSLRDVIRSTIDVFASSASAQGLYLRQYCDERLPAAVQCDALRLKQILFNLIGNAIKFTAEGGIELRATLLEQRPATAVIRIATTDTGIGIDAEAQARVFQPFVQAEANTTRRFGGTGLGLAISERLAGLLGGTLTLDSTPGRGTTVMLTLTLALADAADLPASPAGPDEGSPAALLSQVAHNANREKLLIVDDSAINREVLHRQLAALGYDADEAADGREALALWRAGDYAMLIADCHMPEMDGYELTRRIRAIEVADPRRRRTPIVGYTANAGKDSRDLCTEAGMDDALIKPVSLRALGVRIGAWLPPAHRPIDEAAPPPPHATGLAAMSPVDWQGLLEITGGDETFGREMLHAFVAQKTGEIGQLAGMLGDGDLDEIARLAHRLKGAARTVAARPLAAVLEAIEASARGGDRNAAIESAPGLMHEVERLTRAIGGDEGPRHG